MFMRYITSFVPYLMNRGCTKLIINTVGEKVFIQIMNYESRGGEFLRVVTRSNEVIVKYFRRSELRILQEQDPAKVGHRVTQRHWQCWRKQLQMLFTDPNEII